MMRKPAAKKTGKTAKMHKTKNRKPPEDIRSRKMQGVNITTKDWLNELVDHRKKAVFRFVSQAEIIDALIIKAYEKAGLPECPPAQRKPIPPR